MKNDKREIISKQGRSLVGDNEDYRENAFFSGLGGAADSGSSYPEEQESYNDTAFTSGIEGDDIEKTTHQLAYPKARIIHPKKDDNSKVSDTAPTRVKISALSLHKGTVDKSRGIADIAGHTPQKSTKAAKKSNSDADITKLLSAALNKVKSESKAKGDPNNLALAVQGQQGDNTEGKLDAYTMVRKVLERDIFMIYNNILHVYQPAGVYHPLPPEEFSKFIRRAKYLEGGRKYMSRNMIAEVYAFATSYVSRTFTEDDMDANQHYLAFLDGVLDLRTFHMIPFSPNLPITYQVKARYRDVMSSTGTGEVDAFLDDITGNDGAKRRVLEEWLGYTLSGYSHLKKIVICIGGPNTGKSTLSRLISRMIGPDYTVAFPLDQCHTRFNTVQFFGKRAYLPQEIMESVHVDVPNMKSLSGG